MSITWFTVLLLLFQQIPVPDNMTITYQGETIESVSRSEFSLPVGSQLVDIASYRLYEEKLEKKISKTPANATLDDYGNIIPERIGYTLNRQRFGELFYTYFFGDGPATIEIPTLLVYPKVDSEVLSTIRTKKIGHYVTFFNSRNEERSHNIKLAAEAINNHVIFPGETFSFNKVVGKRTKEKGYLSAPVIVRGELTEGIGGGICQVSSTLYNAVDKAGVHIDERYSHSKRVPYVPEGRDATVSWYGPDFTFHNNHNQPLLIRAKVQGGSIIITVFSSDAINYEPREVESAPKDLPKEIKREKNLLHDTLIL